MYSGPHIKKDGLVFGYDTGYGIADNNTVTRFYKGKNTTNTWNKNTHSYTSGNITATRNATPPTPPPIQGFEVYKLVSNDGGLNQGIMGTSQVVDGVGGNYVHSVYCYLESGTSVTVGQHWHPWAYGSVQSPPLGKWVRLSQTVTNSVDNYGNIANAYRTNGTAYFTAPQYELGSTVTPHVDGTRTSTQSLIDLTKSTNIDVSNVSFDSTGQPTFDGTDDYIIPSTGVGITNYSQPFTMECVFRVPTGAVWANSYASNIFSIAGGYAGHYGFYKAGSDTVGFQIRDASSGSYPQAGGFARDVWHHVIAVWQGGSGLTFYKNGEFAASHSTGKTGAPDSTNLYLGGRRAFGGNIGSYFQGDIPVAKYYNRALSADEVKQNFRAYKNRFDI